MACVTKLPDEKIVSEASALQRAAALDEYGEDVASYSKRLDEKPADCATLCNRAFCYVKLGKFEEARKDAEACIASDETFARGHTRLAQALERSDRPAALRACRRALALDRDDAMALKLLTTLDLDVAAGLSVKKRLADAVEDRRDAVRGALSKGEAAPFAVIDAQQVACVRLALSSQDQDIISRSADALRAVTHARDVALVIEQHLLLVEPLGLDGVHLTDAARSVRKTRKALGTDAIIGAHCGTLRHNGISAAEAGADYISFGPVGLTPLGDGASAEPPLFAWWSEMIELPVVAEGGLTESLVTQLAPTSDFFAIGQEIWNTDSPLDSLVALTAAMRS